MGWGVYHWGTSQWDGGDSLLMTTPPDTHFWKEQQIVPTKEKVYTKMWNESTKKRDYWKEK